MFYFHVMKPKILGVKTNLLKQILILRSLDTVKNVVFGN